MPLFPLSLWSLVGFFLPFSLKVKRPNTVLKYTTSTSWSSAERSRDWHRHCDRLKTLTVHVSSLSVFSRLWFVRTAAARCGYVLSQMCRCMRTLNNMLALRREKRPWPGVPAAVSTVLLYARFVLPHEAGVTQGPSSCWAEKRGRT